MGASSSTGHADVVVVGSGFGGAVSACRLAQAGFRVVILERGRRYQAGDFPPMPAPDALLPESRRWVWGTHQGLWEILDLEEIVSVQAAGYGGGSLIYANVHLRPPAEVFDHRWPKAHRREQLNEYFDLAAAMLNVAPVSESPRASELVKVSALARTARELERQSQFFLPPLAVNYRAGDNGHGEELATCTNCGSCSTGCPEKAKNSLDLNYLSVAERFGARARTQCEVIEIEPLRPNTEADFDAGATGAGGPTASDSDDTDANSSARWRITYVDHLEARTETVTAQHLFLCAGAVHSTRLLCKLQTRLHEKYPDQHAPLHQGLSGIGYFPGGDALGMVYDSKPALEPSLGPTIATSVVHWQDRERGRFFLLQDGGYARELERTLGLLRAPLWVGRNRVTRSIRGDRDERRPPVTTSQPAELTSLPDHLALLLRDPPPLGAGSRLPAQLREFFAELRQALLLPEVVGATIESSIRARHDRWWPTCSFPSEHWFRRACVALERGLIRWLFGEDSALAEHAGKALISGAGLAPEALVGRVLGYDASHAGHRLMLLGMGRDAAPGVLHYNPEQDCMVADLDLYHLVPSYTEQEQLMAQVAERLRGELRVNPAWSFLGKPITVHNQGGCAMSEKPTEGVTDPDGKVHGISHLYVMDGAILCTSVGVNPSATITAIAERNSLAFIRKHGSNPRWPEADDSSGAKSYRQHQRRAIEWAQRAQAKGWHLSPPYAEPKSTGTDHVVGIRFDETMTGYVCEVTTEPEHENDYLACERRGRPEGYVQVELAISTPNLALFLEDQTHHLDVTGTIRIRLPGEANATLHDVEGALELLVKRRKPYGLETEHLTPHDIRRLEMFERLNSQEPEPPVPRESHVANHPKDGSYKTVRDTPATHRVTPDEQFMNYRLQLKGTRWSLVGYKRISDKPGLQGWRDLSCLHVKLVEREVSLAQDGRDHGDGTVRAAGAIRVDLVEFATRQLPSLQATGTEDAARSVWAVTRFASFFFASLQRIYLPELRTAFDAFFRTNSSKVLRGELPLKTAAQPPSGGTRSDAGRTTR